MDFSAQLREAETLEDAIDIYRESQAVSREYEVEGGRIPPGIDFISPHEMVDWAVAKEIPLVEHVNGDRYRITDLGIGIDPYYTNYLTEQGLIPEVDDRGWERHRTVDGQIAISYNQEDASFHDYLAAAAPAIVLGVVTAGLVGPVASLLNIPKAAASSIIQMGASAIQGGDAEDIVMAGLLNYGVESGVAQELTAQALQAVPDPVINAVADLAGDVTDMGIDGLHATLGAVTDALGIEGGAGDIFKLGAEFGSSALEFQNNTGMSVPEILGLLNQVDEEFDDPNYGPDDVASEEDRADMLEVEFEDSIGDWDSWLNTIMTDFPEWDWTPPQEATGNETNAGGGGGGATADNGYVLEGGVPPNHLPTQELPPEIVDDLNTDLPPIEGGLEGEYDESVQQEEEGEGLTIGGFWDDITRHHPDLVWNPKTSRYEFPENMDNNNSGGTGGGSSTGGGTGDGSGTDNGTGSGDGSGNGSGTGDGEGSGEGDTGQPSQTFQPYRGVGGGTSDKDGLFGYRTITPATPANLNLMDYVQSLMARRRNL